MGKTILLILCGFLLIAPASAEPASCARTMEAYYGDLLSFGLGRYYEGYGYSRFPRRERMLRIPPVFNPDPMNRIFSRSPAYLYTIQPNDTLYKIAKYHGTTIEVIKLLNRRKEDHLKPGQGLWLTAPGLQIEIDKTFNRLYLKIGDELIKEYPVSTGKSDTQTPLGIFFVCSRYPYPTWFHKGKVIPGGAPDNLLGTRWLGLDKPQFGIHGTIYPEYIGQSVSKGCVRMKNEDVEELYEYVPVGTPVIIRE